MNLRITIITMVTAALVAAACPGIAQQSDAWQPAVYVTPAYSVGPTVSAVSYVDDAALAPNASVVQPSPSDEPLMLGYDTWAAPGGSGCSCPQCTGRLARPLDWATVEYMFAWTKFRDMPPLVTTSPPGTPFAAAGVLPDATVLFGGERIGDDLQSAGRLDAGRWLDAYGNTGLGVRFFGIEGDSSQFFGQSTGDPILARPFFDIVGGFEDSIVVAYPGEFEGFVHARTSNDVLSAEAYLRFMLARGCGYRLDLVGGYHYNQIDDGIDVESLSTVVGGLNIPLGTTFYVLDRFNARNEFHGGELGLLGELRQGGWTLRALGKISLGNNHQTVTINGTTVITTPPPPVVGVDANGLLAQPTNIGVHERDQTTYIPEVAVTLGYHVTPRLELTIGYSFIYWANVQLAGDAIDRSLNLSQAGGGNLVGPARPAFVFRDTDFWVQGMTFGLNWTY